MRRDSNQKTASRRILLHACPRCHGDLFPDEFEEEFACLQCGRHFGGTAIVEQQKTLPIAA